METVRFNIEYDLLLQKTISSDIEREREKNADVQSVNHIYFVICNSCYWCASYFGIDDLESSSQVLGCHVCDSHNTEIIPISTNESFRIEYNVTRGMELEFYRSNSIVHRQQSVNEQYRIPINL